MKCPAPQMLRKELFRDERAQSGGRSGEVEHHALREGLARLPAELLLDCSYNIVRVALVVYQNAVAHLSRGSPQCLAMTSIEGDLVGTRSVPLGRMLSGQPESLHSALEYVSSNFIERACRNNPLRSDRSRNNTRVHV